MLAFFIDLAVAPASVDDFLPEHPLRPLAQSREVQQFHLESPQPVPQGLGKRGEPLHRTGLHVARGVSARQVARGTSKS